MTILTSVSWETLAPTCAYVAISPRPRREVVDQCRSSGMEPLKKVYNSEATGKCNLPLIDER